MRQPTQRSVKTLYGCIENVQLTYLCLSTAGQFGDTLDSKDLCGHPRKDSRLITGTRADFEYTALIIEFKQLSHTCNDKRLGNCLIGRNRKRMVTICTTP